MCGKSMEESDYQNYGAWAITEPFYADLRKLLPAGGKILEFGSGLGTKNLLQHYSVVSVEDDPNWVGFLNRIGIYDYPHHYIFAPLTAHDIIGDFHPEELWYDYSILENSLEELNWDFDLVIVDGPCSGNTENEAAYLKDMPAPYCDLQGWIGRSGLLHFMKKHKSRFEGKIIMVDDCNRTKDLLLARKIAEFMGVEMELKQPSEGICSTQDKAHAIIRC